MGVAGIVGRYNYIIINIYIKVNIKTVNKKKGICYMWSQLGCCCQFCFQWSLSVFCHVEMSDEHKGKITDRGKLYKFTRRNVSVCLC